VRTRPGNWGCRQYSLGGLLSDVPARGYLSTSDYFLSGTTDLTALGWNDRGAFGVFS
jgi:hypothetical protein